MSRTPTVPAPSIPALVWDRFQILGKITGSYIAGFFATVFYYVILLPFSFIARSNDPLRLRQTQPTWLARKPVPDSLDDARSQA